jgi:hypothetical protein
MHKPLWCSIRMRGFVSFQYFATVVLQHCFRRSAVKHNGFIYYSCFIVFLPLLHYLFPCPGGHNPLSPSCHLDNFAVTFYCWYKMGVFLWQLVLGKASNTWDRKYINYKFSVFKICFIFLNICGLLWSGIFGRYCVIHKVHPSVRDIPYL